LLAANAAAFAADCFLFGRLVIELLLPANPSLFLRTDARKDVLYAGRRDALSRSTSRSAWLLHRNISRRRLIFLGCHFDRPRHRPIHAFGRINFLVFRVIFYYRFCVCFWL